MLSNDQSRLIASKRKVFVYKIYVCVYCIFMYIQMHTHKVYILKIFTCVYVCVCVYICVYVYLFWMRFNRLIALEKKKKMCTQISESVCKDFNTSIHQMQVGIMNK